MTMLQKVLEVSGCRGRGAGALDSSWCVTRAAGPPWRGSQMPRCPAAGAGVRFSQPAGGLATSPWWGGAHCRPRVSPLQIVLPWLTTSEKVQEQARAAYTIAHMLRFVCNFPELLASAGEGRPATPPLPPPYGPPCPPGPRPACLGGWPALPPGGRLEGCSSCGAGEAGAPQGRTVGGGGGAGGLAGERQPRGRRRGDVSSSGSTWRSSPSSGPSWARWASSA